MNLRALAFLTRSLRQESRLISHHVMRAAMALLIMTLFVLQAAAYTSGFGVGVGSSFVATVNLCVYWFLTLVGSIYFSTAIVEEKEEETLPLLKMTGASTFAILIGKSLPRLAVALLFLLVIAPFVMLSVTLGGVLPYGLMSSVLAILVYAISLSQIGLFASVVCRDARRAFTLTAVVWAMFEFSHWWVWLFSEAAFALAELPYSTNSADYYATHEWNGSNWRAMLGAWLHFNLSDIANWLDSRVILGNLNTSLIAMTFREVWTPALTFHLSLAAVFFCSSWLLFEKCTSRAVGEGKAATAVSRSKRSTRRTKRVRGPALIWKSWQNLSGGITWLIVRAVGFPMMIIGLVAGIFAAMDERLDPETLGAFTIFMGVIFCFGNVCLLAGKVFNSEIQQKTLSTLLMMPLSVGRLVSFLLAGLLPAFLSSFTAIIVGVILLSNDSYALGDFLETFEEPWFYVMLVWALTTIHVGMLLSVFTRYGGMLIAIAVMWFLIPTIFFSLIGILALATGSPSGFDDFMEYVLPVLLIPASLGICVATYWPLMKRLEILGARS